MIHGSFPGALPKEAKPTTTTKKTVTAIIGPPNCGKTTLRKVVESASVFIGGHVSADSSETIDWHQKPENESPYYAEAIEVEKIRAAGGLVPNELIFKLICWWLSVKEIEMAKRFLIEFIQRFDVSGFPRTREQYEMMCKIFGLIKIYAIDLTEDQANKNRLSRIKKGIQREDDKPERFQKRWHDYRQFTLPFIEWGVSSGIIIPIKFNHTLKEKALKISRGGDYTLQERASVQRQILNNTCDAYWLTKEIDDPELYEAHMRSKNAPAKAHPFVVGLETSMVAQA